jgi:myxalamid-type polyketide synthase MxaB/epothilone polyketide synthase D
MERFREVLAPKMLGSWNLHELTRDKPLDHFVLYSAAAALFGAPGLGNYVAANVFLDTLAHHRRSLGLPALSIDWGLFAGVGMGVKAEREGLATQRGLHSFTSAEGAAILLRLLESGRAQMGAVAFDARQWMEFYLSAAWSNRLSPLREEVHHARRANAPSRKALGRAFREAEPAERRRLVEQAVREQVAGVLRMDAVRLDPRVPLRSLGIDSIMGLELRNGLESSLGLTLSATLIWTYPTVAALSEHLTGELASAEDPIREPPPEQDRSAPPLIPLASERHTDDELLAAFDASMSRMERSTEL